MEGSPPREALRRSPEAVSRSAGPAVDPSPASPGAQHQHPGDEDAVTPAAALRASLGAAAGGGAAPGASPGADVAAVTPGTAAARTPPGHSPRLWRATSAARAGATPVLTPAEKAVANAQQRNRDLEACLDLLRKGKLQAGLKLSMQMEVTLAGVQALGAVTLPRMQEERVVVSGACAMFKELVGGVDEGIRTEREAGALVVLLDSHGALEVVKVSKELYRELVLMLQHLRCHEDLHKEAGDKLVALKAANKDLADALARKEAEQEGEHPAGSGSVPGSARLLQDYGELAQVTEERHMPQYLEEAVRALVRVLEGLEEVLGSPLAVQVGCLQVLGPLMDAINTLLYSYFDTTKQTVQMAVGTKPPTAEDNSEAPSTSAPSAASGGGPSRGRSSRVAWKKVWSNASPGLRAAVSRAVGGGGGGSSSMAPRKLDLEGEEEATLRKDFGGTGGGKQRKRMKEREAAAASTPPAPRPARDVLADLRHVDPVHEHAPYRVRNDVGTMAELAQELLAALQRMAQQAEEERKQAVAAAAAAAGVEEEGEEEEEEESEGEEEGEEEQQQAAAGTASEPAEHGTAVGAAS
ncbi:hypothetical protein HYH03_010883 [Edaphochlamys debaryana]|uniref:Uncharacterized protein n=1 Tax=Edaphochlamys debaryana TaxID=47281 RepID=A0A835XT51_9CHLO|nr:hypothetical protein HYH03_010883 [Edaphochlamys debaryana]|eukprot:KAG2490727.1 hypothetical protein HYH03_010883 [Edaphochlamys debaryana]